MGNREPVFDAEEPVELRKEESRFTSLFGGNDPDEFPGNEGVL